MIATVHRAAPALMPVLQWACGQRRRGASWGPLRTLLRPITTWSATGRHPGSAAVRTHAAPKPQQHHTCTRSGAGKHRPAAGAFGRLRMGCDDWSLVRPSACCAFSLPQWLLLHAPLTGVAPCPTLDDLDFQCAWELVPTGTCTNGSPT